MPKVAVIIFADTETHADLGRMTNALEIVKEFKEARDEATLIFDGAGTKWLAEIAKPDHKLHRLYDQIQDKVGGACKFCAAAFHVTDAVKATGVPLLGEYEAHPSIRKLVVEGYAIITL